MYDDGLPDICVGDRVDRPLGRGAVIPGRVIDVCQLGDVISSVTVQSLTADAPMAFTEPDFAAEDAGWTRTTEYTASALLHSLVRRRLVWSPEEICDESDSQVLTTDSPPPSPPPVPSLPAGPDAAADWVGATIAAAILTA